MAAPANLRRFHVAGMLADGKLVADWAERFHAIPPLDRDEVRASPEDFLASADDIVYRGMTSGTRSTALVYFAGTEWEACRRTGRDELLRRFGLPDDLPIVNLASRLPPSRTQDVSLVGPIDPSFLGEARRLLKERRWIVRGYPSRLTQLSLLLEPADTSRVAGVIVTGEMLFAHQRDAISGAFRAPLHNEYGCYESGISGSGCPVCGAMVLDWSRAYYEVLDGDLVTTDLMNTSMPMIRYRCGDKVRVLRSPDCNCGGLRLLGRREDGLWVASGWRQAGEIDLPSLPGIGAYAVNQRHSKVGITGIAAQGAAMADAEIKLHRWAADLFPRSEIVVAVEAWPVATPAPVLLPAEQWIAFVTREGWSGTDSTMTLPAGPLAEVAGLLASTIFPREISGERMVSAGTREYFERVCGQGFDDLVQELIACRILLLAWCAGTTNRDFKERNQDRVAERLNRALARASSQPGSEAWAGQAALDGDLARRLFGLPVLPTQGWAAGPPDRLSIQLALTGLQAASLRAPKALRDTLRPFLSLLIGDLGQFAPVYGPWLFASWAHLLAGDIDDVPPAPDGFTHAWVMARAALVGGDEAGSAAWLNRLRRRAGSAAERVRAWLEMGYADLAFHRPLDPVAWLRRFNRMGCANAGEAPDTLSWAPILRAIAPGLLACGQRSAAYQCLVAAAVPSAALSTFDARSRANDKISVVRSDIRPPVQQ